MPLRQKDRIEANGLSANQRKDQISHFILRLAYCRTEELRRWFLTHEIALLKHRLRTLPDNEMNSFMYANGMKYDVVSTEEKTSLGSKLWGLEDVKEGNVHSTKIYKYDCVVK